MQKRFHGKLFGLDNISYKERLDKLQLRSVECQRLDDNLMEVYKIMRDMDRVDS